MACFDDNIANACGAGRLCFADVVKAAADRLNEKGKQRMANELVKSEGGNMLSLNFGAVNLDGLTESQQNALKNLVAQKSVELAFELKKQQIHLESTTAELDTTISAMERARRSGLRINDEFDMKTPNGTPT